MQQSTVLIKRNYINFPGASEVPSEYRPCDFLEAQCILQFQIDGIYTNVPLPCKLLAAAVVTSTFKSDGSL